MICKLVQNFINCMKSNWQYGNAEASLQSMLPNLRAQDKLRNKVGLEVLKTYLV